MAWISTKEHGNKLIDLWCQLGFWTRNTWKIVHTTSVPEAPTERLSVRYFYQPKRNISSPSWRLLGQHLQIKGKRGKLADRGGLDLLITATRIIRLKYNNKRRFQAKVLLRSEWDEDLEPLLQTQSSRGGLWNQWLSLFGRFLQELDNPSLSPF